MESDGSGGRSPQSHSIIFPDLSLPAQTLRWNSTQARRSAIGPALILVSSRSLSCGIRSSRITPGLSQPFYNIPDETRINRAATHETRFTSSISRAICSMSLSEKRTGTNPSPGRYSAVCDRKYVLLSWS